MAAGPPLATVNTELKRLLVASLGGGVRALRACVRCVRACVACVACVRALRALRCVRACVAWPAATPPS